MKLYLWGPPHLNSDEATTCLSFYSQQSLLQCPVQTVPHEQLLTSPNIHFLIFCGHRILLFSWAPMQTASPSPPLYPEAKHGHGANCAEMLRSTAWLFSLGF